MGWCLGQSSDTGHCHCSFHSEVEDHHRLGKKPSSVESFQNMTFGMNLSHVKSCQSFAGFLHFVDLQLYFLPILTIASCPKPSQVTQTVPVSWFFQDTKCLQLQLAVCMLWLIPDTSNLVARGFRPAVDRGPVTHSVVCAWCIFAVGTKPAAAPPFPLVPSRDFPSCGTACVV